jgi:nucleotide-binding universal stress UspA family protein
MKVLLAVDGSSYSLSAVSNLIEHADWYRSPLEVELVYVNPVIPYSGRVSQVVGKNQIKRYYQEEGEAALAKARKMLDAAGIKHSSHIRVGPVAETLVHEATAFKCDFIFIGTHGRTAAGNMLLGSVANKVLHIAKVPVLLVR